MNIENLTTLANYLERVSPDAFDMGKFSVDKHGKELGLHVHECGTVACAVGWGPAAGFPPLPSDEFWTNYSHRVFGLYAGDAAWDWCFGWQWGGVDNTPTGAAKRIRYLIKRGVPPDAEDQMRGATPYIFGEKVYKLGSSPAVYAPGIIAWAIAGYWNEPDREQLRKVVTSTWSGIPDEVVDQVLSGTLPYSVEDEAVVISV